MLCLWDFEDYIEVQKRSHVVQRGLEVLKKSDENDKKAEHENKATETVSKNLKETFAK